MKKVKKFLVFLKILKLILKILKISLKTFFSILFAKKRWKFTLPFLIIVYFFSPLYWVTEAVYWEAVKQSRVEQNMIRHVLSNRKDDSSWPDSYIGVILDGKERGNNRDFTYRDHHKYDYLPDQTPILPLLHAWKNGNLNKLLIIQLDTVWFLIGEYSGFLDDPTEKAVFYKVAKHRSSWFDKMERNGKMCFTVNADAHRFYNRCEGKVPVSLQGSKKSVEKAFEFAKSKGFEFASNVSELKKMTPSQVVNAENIVNTKLVDVSYPYLRPIVKVYLTRLAKQYRNYCGSDLVVTSMLRFDGKFRLRNSSVHSVHPAGIAFDLRSSGIKCLSWLKKALLLGEKRGYVDVTQEKNPPHFHVVVYEDVYEKWLYKK